MTMYSRSFLFFTAYCVAFSSAYPFEIYHHRKVHHHRRNSPAPIPQLEALVADVQKQFPLVTSPPASAESTTDLTSQSLRLLADLFPVPGFSSSWTTCSASSSAQALADITFRPTYDLRSVPHIYRKAPDGKDSLAAHYPKGSFNFGRNQGGFSFYAPGPPSVDLTTAKEATFGYSVFFPKDFDFNLGGKLPGLYGGNSANEALACSGESRSCFSLRLMWRDSGRGEIYTYLPLYIDAKFAANEKICNVAPFSDCNPSYGASVGRGSFTFPTGAWTTISERIRLNDVGSANGEIELFVNGQSVIMVSGLILRDSAAGKIRGLQMQTFFGGSDTLSAAPKDQDVYFSDFSVAIIEAF